MVIKIKKIRFKVKKDKVERWLKNTRPVFLAFEKILKKKPDIEIYLVGGAIRDLIMSGSPQDLDFVVRKVEIEELEKLLAPLGKVNLVGRNFSVLKFIPKGWKFSHPVDLALPRKDYALGTGAYRDFEVQSDPYLAIEEDLSRRDFTINAIALPVIKQGKVFLKGNFFENIIDPFYGRKDIKNKLIRCVGDPEKRFQEDFSRMLRALRLSCQLGFGIEKKTFSILKKNISLLNKINRQVVLEKNASSASPKVIEQRVVPWEIIGEEFLKSFSYNPLKAFDLYDESGAFEQIVPELLKMKGCPQPKNWHSEGDVWQHTRLCLKNLDSTKFKRKFGANAVNPELILAVLFHDIGKPYTIKKPPETDRIRFSEHDIVGAKITKEILERLKLFGFPDFPFNYKEVIWLVQHHMILIQGDISKMKPSTIEKYFFNPVFRGDNLLKLSFVDILSTVPSRGKPDFSDFKAMEKRIEEIKKMSGSKGKREKIPHILSGGEIMNRYKLKPGPKIGELKQLIRELQLKGKIRTKDQAYAFLDKLMKK